MNTNYNSSFCCLLHPRLCLCLFNSLYGHLYFISTLLFIMYVAVWCSLCVRGRPAQMTCRSSGSPCYCWFYSLANKLTYLPSPLWSSCSSSIHFIAMFAGLSSDCHRVSIWPSNLNICIFTISNKDCIPDLLSNSSLFISLFCLQPLTLGHKAFLPFTFYTKYFLHTLLVKQIQDFVHLDRQFPRLIGLVLSTALANVCKINPLLVLRQMPH